ncbi:hypothetical protein [Natronococcus sp. A-GB7]|uniref:hypothetical protein n=1 Tax=Natronococcus sp. A-GB7 TaxID=3037649 RepID=UPI002420047A|nr:hypothetical protein [Natronococcus sp. A-GB7]MDG5817786.1 hypothetical protein [Natronococcus sp. A-GB7]
MPDGESERRMAVCASCESAYAAEVWPDGTIKPIGTKEGCHCGSAEFRVVEHSSDVVPEPEEPTDAADL